MKKVMMVAILLIASFCINAQTKVSLFSNHGTVSIDGQSWNRFSSVGIEVLGKFGVEYGFSNHGVSPQYAMPLISSIQEFIRNDINNVLPNLEYKSYSNFYSAHYSLVESDKLNINFGGGVTESRLVLKGLNATEYSDKVYNGFVKFGFSHNLNNVVAINTQFMIGQVYGGQVGIKLNFK